MRSRGRTARWERRQFRQLTKDLDIGSGFGEPPRPRHHVAKDALGAVERSPYNIVTGLQDLMGIYSGGKTAGATS